MDWLLFRIQLFVNHCFKSADVYVLVADETTKKKAGKSTHGLGYFYSSLFKKAIRSVSFLGFSLVSTEEEKSYFLSVNQLIKKSLSKSSSSKPSSSKKKKRKKKSNQTPQKRRQGRPHIKWKGAKINPIRNLPTCRFKV